MDLVTDKALDVDDKTIEEMFHEDIDILGFRDGLWHGWHVDVAVMVLNKYQDDGQCDVYKHEFYSYTDDSGWFGDFGFDSRHM